MSRMHISVAQEREKGGVFYTQQINYPCRHTTNKNYKYTLTVFDVYTKFTSYLPSKDFRRIYLVKTLTTRQILDKLRPERTDRNAAFT